MIFARRDIPSHEELTLDYNCSPLNVRKELVCLCGASTCKSFVYSHEANKSP